jgi:hypothetical protein
VEPSLIRIDIQVYQYLESRRTDPAQTLNDLLREMIGLPPSNENVLNDGVDTTVELSRGWSGAAELPNGTKLRMTYNGQMYAGVIVQGAWHTGGASYHSPSGVAGGVARARRGTPVSVDGWAYWEVQLPGRDSWIRIDALRKRTSRKPAPRQPAATET